MPTRRNVHRLTAALVAAMAIALSVPPPMATAKEYEVIAVRQRFVSGSGPSCRVTPDGTDTVRIAPEDVVGWTNCTFENHTVTFDDGGHDTVIAPGQRTTRRFPSTGTFSYFCRIHNDAGMKGRVVVENPAPSKTPASSPTSPAPERSGRTPTTRAPSTPTTRDASLAAAPVVPDPPSTTTPAIVATSRSTVPTADTGVDDLDVAIPTDNTSKSSPSSGLRLAGWLALTSASVAVLVASRRRPSS